MMRKYILALFLILSMASGMAATSVISPNTPDDIELNSSNNYEIKKEFDGSGSTPDNVTYSWTWEEGGETRSGSTANFTFDTGSSKDNTIKLIVNDGTETDEASVTQTLRDDPNITSTSVSSTSEDLADSDGKIDFTVEAEDTFDQNLSYEWTFSDGSVAASQANHTYNFDNTGDYTLTVNVSDEEGYYSTEQVSTISITDSSTSNGDDSNEDDESSDSDDEDSDENEINVDNSDETPGKLVRDVGPGNPAQVSFNRSVSSVSIEVKNSVGSVEINVEREDTRPSEVSETDKQVYRYMDITSNVSEEDIDKGEIDFSVSKDWINSQGIERSQIILKRYSENWEDLNTSVESDNSTHVNYKAETPGFSVFAISHEETQDNETVGNETQQDTGNETQTDNQETGNLLDRNNLIIGLVVFLLVILVAVLYYFKHSNTSGSSKEQEAKSGLKQLTEKLREEVEGGEGSEDDSEALRILEEAEELYEEGEYEESLEKQDQVRNLL